MNTYDENYLVEIDSMGWIYEALSEVFDNALQFMGPHCVIYGGAIRDCLAGLELKGDLDIAVPQNDLREISRRFRTDPKWIPVKGMDLSSYGKPLPMASIVPFKTINGRIAQVITASKISGKDPLQNAIHLARRVDIICCGVIMTQDGRIFEVLPNAYDDCRNKVLNINKQSDDIHIDALPSRVDKLMKRGWKNMIDVEKETKRVKKLQVKKKKIEAKKNPFAKKIGRTTFASSFTGRLAPRKEKSKTHFEFGPRDRPLSCGLNLMKTPELNIGRVIHECSELAVRHTIRIDVDIKEEMLEIRSDTKAALEVIERTAMEAPLIHDIGRRRPSKYTKPRAITGTAKGINPNITFGAPNTTRKKAGKVSLRDFIQKPAVSNL